MKLEVIFRVNRHISPGNPFSFPAVRKKRGHSIVETQNGQPFSCKWSSLQDDGKWIRFNYTVFLIYHSYTRTPYPPLILLSLSEGGKFFPISKRKTLGTNKRKKSSAVSNGSLEVRWRADAMRECLKMKLEPRRAKQRRYRRFSIQAMMMAGKPCRDRNIVREMHKKLITNKK